jgi:hypothetical protein
MSEMARRAAAKMKKAAYKRALQVVGSVVREWNPYCLLAGGAPADEFDSEIAGVVAQIPRIKTEREAAFAGRLLPWPHQPGALDVVFAPSTCSDRSFLFPNADSMPARWKLDGSANRGAKPVRRRRWCSGRAR